MKVGYSQGSMTPAEFNITDYVTSGSNTIQLKYTGGAMDPILKIRISGA